MAPSKQWSVPSKREEFMFRRTRYQQGTLDRVRRKEGPDCWIFRWRETDDNGKRVRRNKVVGTAEDYPAKTKTLRPTEALRFTVMHAEDGNEHSVESVSRA